LQHVNPANFHRARKVKGKSGDVKCFSPSDQEILWQYTTLWQQPPMVAMAGLEGQGKDLEGE